VNQRGCERTAMARVERLCPPANRQSGRCGAEAARGPAPARATPRRLHRAGTFVLLAGRTRAKRLGIARSASESREPLPALLPKRFANVRARSTEGTALRARRNPSEVGGARTGSGEALRRPPGPFDQRRRAPETPEPARPIAHRFGIGQACSEPAEPARRIGGSAPESAEPVQDRARRSGIGGARPGSRSALGNWARRSKIGRACSEPAAPTAESSPSRTTYRGRHTLAPRSRLPGGLRQHRRGRVERFGVRLPRRVGGRRDLHGQRGRLSR